MFKSVAAPFMFCPPVLIFCTSIAAAQKPAVFLGSPPPKQLSALAPLIGQWNVEATVKPSLTVKQGYTSRGEAKCRWIHNGHYLQLEGRAESPSGLFEWTEIISYDERSSHFRRFVFSTEGIVAESVGNWNDEEQTMTWTVVRLPEKWSGKASTRLDPDRVDFSLLVVNDQGLTTRSSSMTMKRKKREN